MTKREIIENIDGILSSKKIGNNTVKYETENGSFIRLYNTDIVSFLKNGDIVLNTGGWKTSTTKNRINDFLPSGYTIFQENSIWYLSKIGTFEKIAVFADGITITKNNKILHAGDDPQKTLKLKKQIYQYVNEYITALKNKKIGKPSSGDCYYCSMHTVNDNKPLGDAIKDTSHLLAHFKEKYFVPSLLMNAIEVYPISLIAKSYLGYVLGYHEEDAGSFSDIAIEQISKSLKRYIKKQFGIA